MSALRYDPSTKSIITVNQDVIAFVNSSDPTLGPAMAAAVGMRDALRGLIDKWIPDWTTPSGMPPVPLWPALTEDSNGPTFDEL